MIEGSNVEDFIEEWAGENNPAHHSVICDRRHRQPRRYDQVAEDSRLKGDAAQQQTHIDMFKICRQESSHGSLPGGHVQPQLKMT